MLGYRRRALKWPDENGLSERDSRAAEQGEPSARLGERDELDMLLIALAITKCDKYHLLIVGDLAYLCSAVTGLPKSVGALDNRQQRTAFVSHNGRSTLAAGIGGPAPIAAIPVTGPSLIRRPRAFDSLARGEA